MNDSLIIFSREWTVTRAQDALLAGREVLFVSHSFYWINYNLTEWFRQEQFGF